MLSGSFIIMRHGNRYPIKRNHEFHNFLYKKYKIHNAKLTKIGFKESKEIGYKLAVYPLTVMSSAMKAMTNSLNLLMKDEDRSGLLLDFSDLRQKIGFDDYYEISSKYETSKRS